MGCKAGEKDAESLVKFGGAVVIGEDGAQCPEVGEVFGWQAVQAKAQDGFVFFRVHDVFLEFVQDVAVEESVVGAVDVQGR